MPWTCSRTLAAPACTWATLRDTQQQVPPPPPLHLGSQTIHATPWTRTALGCGCESGNHQNTTNLLTECHPKKNESVSASVLSHSVDTRRKMHFVLNQPLSRASMSLSAQVVYKIDSMFGRVPQMLIYHTSLGYNPVPAFQKGPEGQRDVSETIRLCGGRTCSPVCRYHSAIETAPRVQRATSYRLRCVWLTSGAICHPDRDSSSGHHYQELQPIPGAAAEPWLLI